MDELMKALKILSHHYKNQCDNFGRQRVDLMPLVREVIENFERLPKEGDDNVDAVATDALLGAIRTGRSQDALNFQMLLNIRKESK